MNGKMQSKFHIYTYPRIHFSLIGMNDVGYRINGGFGCSISKPLLDCYFEKSDKLQIIDKRENGLIEKERQKLLDTIQTVCSKYSFKIKYSCYIQSDVIYSHVGLGATTMIYMSCIEALFILNGIQYNRDMVINNSNRGGTSGVGINTYFDGGASFDIGVSPTFNTIRPSSLGQQNQIPLQICKFSMPSWSVGIIIPSHISRMTECQEELFFRKNTPITIDEVKDILYEIVYGIIPSLKEGEFNVFCKAINNLQATKWKSSEWDVYGEELHNLKETLVKNGATAIGLSSLGPMLYFMAPIVSDVINSIRKIYPNSICLETSFNNSSRRIIYGN